MRHDHFSARAAGYAAYRPSYPPALFSYLARLAPARRAAWDCATGNGQAALGLADHFARILATDASAAQLAHALPHERVTYREARAESSGLPAESVDLVTVAQALHWLDLDPFFAEAKRVLVPGGVIAAWSYGSASPDAASLGEVFSTFEHETVGPWWPAERRLVIEGYRTIPFPFREHTPPPFTLRCDWTLDELVGYAGTWSGTARYVAGTRHDPLPELRRRLAVSWGDPARRRTIRWPLALRVGVAEGRAGEVALG